MEFTRPRGTRDFLPGEVLKRRNVENSIRDTFEKFGFGEVSTPTFENLELITAKSGDEIREGIYHFKDKSDRDLALRPELTAPVMRLYVNEMQRRPKPVKLYYIANCFRYERSQAGRYREFWQAGVESIGSANPEADAEVIAVAVSALESLGLRDFELHIGHIGLLREILEMGKVSEEEQNRLMGIIDKGDENQIDAAIEKLSADVGDTLKKVIGLKGEPNDVINKAKKLPDSKEKIKGLEETLGHLESFGVSNYQLNLGIARGLDYYTGTVFEIYAKGLGAQNQICGGGNYSLTEAFGGQKTATSGFAFGFDRVMLAIEAQGTTGQEDSFVEYFVVPTSSEHLNKAIRISASLRKKSKCEVDIMRRKLGKALSYADAKNIPFVIIVGEEEILKKDMKTGKQESIKIKDLE